MNYIVPPIHAQTYKETCRQYSLAPINIRDNKGRTIAMGPSAEKTVGGSLCLITFEVSPLYIS